MKKQSSENKLVITEEFIFDQNKLSKDQNNHFKLEPRWILVKINKADWSLLERLLLLHVYRYRVRLYSVI